MESLPAPHLPSPEGESQGPAATPLPSSSFLDEGCICGGVLAGSALPKALGSREQAGLECRQVQL